RVDQQPLIPACGQRRSGAGHDGGKVVGVKTGRVGGVHGVMVAAVPPAGQLTAPWRRQGRRGGLHSCDEHSLLRLSLAKAAGNGGGAMATTTVTDTRTAPTVAHWILKGTGYEFCNCDFGCGCN